MKAKWKRNGSLKRNVFTFISLPSDWMSIRSYSRWAVLPFGHILVWLYLVQLCSR